MMLFNFPCPFTFTYFICFYIAVTEIMHFPQYTETLMNYECPSHVRFLRQLAGSEAFPLDSAQVRHSFNVFVSAGTVLSNAALKSIDCTIVSQLLQQPFNPTLLPSFVGNLHQKLTSTVSFQLIQTFNQNFSTLNTIIYKEWRLHHVISVTVT